MQSPLSSEQTVAPQGACVRQAPLQQTPPRHTCEAQAVSTVQPAPGGEPALLEPPLELAEEVPEVPLDVPWLEEAGVLVPPLLLLELARELLLLLELARELPLLLLELVGELLLLELAEELPLPLLLLDWLGELLPLLLVELARELPLLLLELVGELPLLLLELAEELPLLLLDWLGELLPLLLLELARELPLLLDWPGELLPLLELPAAVVLLRDALPLEELPGVEPLLLEPTRLVPLEELELPLVVPVCDELPLPELPVVGPPLLELLPVPASAEMTSSASAWFAARVVCESRKICRSTVVWPAMAGMPLRTTAGICWFAFGSAQVIW
jgi:hypothetical protein